LVTSLPDLKKINPQRYHFLLHYLSKKHNITILSVNAWWLPELNDDVVQQCLENIDYFYFSSSKISFYFQELFILHNLKEINKLINLSSFDVHINFHSFIAGNIIQKKMQYPYVFDFCDDMVDYISISPQIPYLLKPIAKKCLNFLIQKTIKMSDITTYTNLSLKEKYNIPSSKSCLVPNGIEFIRFSNVNQNNSLDNRVSSKDFVIGFVGYLGNWIKLEPIIKVIKQLENTIPLKLIIVGDGPILNNLKNLAKKYQIVDNVIFTGNIPYDQIPYYISIMDVCLIPFEDSPLSQNAFPIKLIEYMASGKPVISTPLIGVKNAVDDLIFYASDENQLKEILSILFHDSQLRFRMGYNGKDYVKEKYDWKYICPNFEKNIMNVVNSKK